MKKTITLLLALLLVLSFAACKPERPVNPGASPSPTPTQKPQEDSAFMDVVTALSKDAFTTDEVHAQGYGLSSLNEVGVDADKFANEIKYPMPADSEFAPEAVFQISLEDGITGFKQVLEEARAINEEGQKVKLKFPKGEFRMNTSKAGNYAMAFTGFNGLYLEGDDTLLTVDCPETDWKGCAVFSDCTDVHMSGFAVDYVVKPTFTAKAVSCDTERKLVTYEICEEFLDYFNGKSDVEVISYVEFDRYTDAPRENGNFLYYDQIASATVSGNQLTVTFNAAITEIPKGTCAAMALVMRTNSCIRLERCKDVYLENITVYTCPSMAYVGANCENVYFNRTSVMRRPGSERRMTACADGMHFVHCQGNLVVTNSLIENTHDDALNVKCGYYSILESYNPATDTIVTRRTQPDSVLPPVGNTVEIYDKDLNRVATAIVEESSEAAGNYTMRLRTDYDGYEKGMFVSDVSCSPKFLFSNNLVRNKRNRGCLVQVRDGEISNNAFIDIVHGVLNIHSEVISGAYETMMPKDIVVKNNKFINGRSTDINVFTLTHGTNGIADAGAITGVAIENNFFAKTARSAISIGSASDCKVSHNLFRNVARSPESELSNCAIMLDNSKDIVIEGNYNSNDIGNQDFSGLRTNRATNPKTITLKGNINLDYPRSNEEIPVTEIAKGGSVTVDGSFADWEGVGIDIPIVGESLATGDPATGYQSDFEVRKLKMAWTDDGIYLALDVFDNKLDFKSAEGFWGGDCGELFITDKFMANADYTLLKGDASCTVAQVGIGSWGAYCYPGRTSESILTTYRKQWKSVYKQTSDGWCAELFLPFTALGTLKTSIDAQREIGLAFIVADADRTSPTRVRIQVGNVPHFVEGNKIKTDKAPKFRFTE